MRRKLERAFVFAFLAACPLWLPTLSPSLGSGIRMSVTESFMPLLKAAQAARSGIVTLFLGLVKAPYLEEENRLLREQVGTLLAHEETHQQLFQENARLRNLVGFQAKAPWQILPAQVIGREYSLWSRTLLLDKGREAGVRVGQAVIASVGLVGRISDAGRKVSRAILLTDPHFRVAATTAESRISGLVTGTSSGECLLTFLPLSAESKPGEMVVSSGGRSFCPEGVSIGRLESLKNDPSGMFRMGSLRLAVDASAAEDLFVVLSSSS